MLKRLRAFLRRNDPVTISDEVAHRLANEPKSVCIDPGGGGGYGERVYSIGDVQPPRPAVIRTVADGVVARRTINDEPITISDLVHHWNENI